MNFDATNWKTAQTVTVRVPADTDVADRTVVIRHSPGSYRGGFTTVQIKVTDTGTGTAGVALSDQVLVLDEGDSDTYTVRLNTRPGGRVTVAPTSGDASATVSPGRLTFNRRNWRSAQTVTVRSVADVDITDKIVNITHAVNGYAGVTSARSVSAVVFDTGSGTDRVVVSEQALALDEGRRATYTVRLDNRPAGQVTVTPASADAGAVAVSPQALTFGPMNWRTPRTVTVRAVADADIDDETVQVTHAVAGYGSVTTADPVAVTVTDMGTGTDRVSVSPPRLEVDEGGSATYTVRLDNRPGAKQQVTVTPASGDRGAAAVAPGTLTFAATNWKDAQTVTVRGVADTDLDDEATRVTHGVSGYGSVTTADR